MDVVTIPAALTTITGATTGLQGDLLAIGGIAVGVGAAIFALRKGWQFFRGLVK